MKPLTLVFILHLLCNEALAQVSAPLYQIEDVSERHNIKIKGKLVTKGQVFYSYKDLQFSNCTGEYVLASGNFNKSLLIKGRCIDSKIVPYIYTIPVEIYMGSLPKASIFLKNFEDDFEASRFIEDLVRRGREPYMEHFDETINVGIELEYHNNKELSFFVSTLKRSYPQAKVINRQTKH